MSFFNLVLSRSQRENGETITERTKKYILLLPMLLQAHYCLGGQGFRDYKFETPLLIANFL